MTDPMELVGRLEAHDGSHERGCEGRNMSCTCGDDERGQALLTEAAACIREMVGAQTELAAAARAYFVGWMMDEADDSGPEYTVCSIEQHLAAKRLGEALPPAPGAEQ